MAFFDKIGESVNKGVNGMSTMFEVSGLSSKLRNCEEALNSRYLELGKLFYEQSKTSPSEEYNELFAKIDEAHAAIETVNQEIMSVKKTVKCPNCEAELPKDTAFCSQCGTKIAQ